ncbi:MAG: hypothetical protein J5846_08060 [Desulfovibrio sp.]|nr:hypothetical protein [Desulfovibrio sp.]
MGDILRSVAWHVATWLVCVLIGGCMTTIFPGADEALAEDWPDGACEDTSRRDAPKTIVSKDILTFSVHFAWNDEVGHSQNGIFVPDAWQPYPQGIWFMSLEKRKHSAVFTIRCDEGNLQIAGEVPLAELTALQKLLEEHHLAKLNGHSKRDSALGEVLDLVVVYASGERITAHASGGSATMPENWSALWFLDFFAGLAKSAGIWPIANE